MSALAVLVRTDLIAEIILRSEGRKDPSKLIEDLLESYLDRTIGDADIWSQKHAEAMAQTLPDDSMAKYGNPTKGYQWQNRAPTKRHQAKDGIQVEMVFCRSSPSTSLL